MEMMVETLGKGIGAGWAVTPGPAGTTGMTGKRAGTGAPDKAPGQGVDLPAVAVAGPAAGTAGAGPGKGLSARLEQISHTQQKGVEIKERPIPEAPDEEGPPLEKGMDDKVGEVEMKEGKEGAQGDVQMKEET